MPSPFAPVMFCRVRQDYKPEYTLEFGLDVTDFTKAMTGKDARFFLHVISKGGRVGWIKSPSWTTRERS